MLNTQFLYQQKAHFILYALTSQNFNITICKNFIGPQRSIGQKKVQFRILIIHIKNNRIIIKKLTSQIIYIGQFYL